MATQLVAINDFLIDCSINENHSFESQITEYPVESGSNIVDNIRLMPIVIEMECLVSNSPIGVMKEFRSNLRSEDNETPATKPSDDAYNMLQRIRDKRNPVIIRTSLRTFENMALKTLTIPRSGKSGDDLRFSATFQQILTVTNKRELRVSTPGGKGKKKVTKPLQDAERILIKIDTRNREWYDPDFQFWRRTAAYHKPEVISESTFVTTTTSTWWLSRGIKSPFGDSVNQENPITAIGTKAIGINFKRNVILVPIGMCKLLGDFTINGGPVTFGPLGSSTSTSTPRTLHNRTI